jgi:hypothetical protein
MTSSPKESTAPDLGAIVRWLFEQIIELLISHAQSVVAALALLAVIVVILLGGKSIWRFTRAAYAHTAGCLSTVVWRIKRGLSSRASAGIGGGKTEMVIVEPAGESPSYSELNAELAQLAKTIGRVNVCVIPSDSSLLPDNLSPSTSYVYLFRGDVPTEILRQQLGGFRRYKVKPISVEWPVLFETDTWGKQLRGLVGSLRQFGGDIARAETHKKRIGYLYVAIKNAAAAIVEWWSRDPQVVVCDYIVDPETQNQHATLLRSTPTGASTPNHLNNQYPVQSLLKNARHLGNACFFVIITPPPESDHRMKGFIRPLLDLIGESDENSPSESDDDTPALDPDSQFGIDQRLLIWSEAGVDVSDVEGAFKNAFRVCDGEELQIRGKLQDDHQAAKAYKRLVNADGPRSRPSTGSIIGRVRSNRSPVVLVDGDRLAVLSLVGPKDGTDLPPIDPGEPEE